MSIRDIQLSLKPADDSPFKLLEIVGNRILLKSATRPVRIKTTGIDVILTVGEYITVPEFHSFNVIDVYDNTPLLHNNIILTISDEGFKIDSLSKSNGNYNGDIKHTFKSFELESENGFTIAEPDFKRVFLQVETNQQLYLYDDTLNLSIRNYILLAPNPSYETWGTLRLEGIKAHAGLNCSTIGNNATIRIMQTYV